MCIIIYKPKDRAIPLERLFYSKDRNPHGFGISWANKRKVNIYKTMCFDEFLEKYSKLSRFDCLIHFRYATKGEKTKENCHPFRINKNLIMAHNGTIQDLDGVNNKRSDSRAFAHSYVKPMVKIDKGFTYSANGKKWLKGMISMQTNKLVFMNHHGNPTFINGDLGHWSMGCWYSNETYKPRQETQKLPLGYKRLARKHRATSSEIINKLPVGYGRLRTGKNLIDEIEEDIAKQEQTDLWADVQEQMDQNQLDHHTECNTSVGYDCSEEDSLM